MMVRDLLIPPQRWAPWLHIIHIVLALDQTDVSEWQHILFFFRNTLVSVLPPVHTLSPLASPDWQSTFIRNQRNCLKPIWDGQSHGFCSIGCWDAARASAQGSLPTCQWYWKRQTWDGKLGYCGNTCRIATASAQGSPIQRSVRMCQWCTKRPTWDGKPGYCGNT